MIAKGFGLLALALVLVICQASGALADDSASQAPASDTAASSSGVGIDTPEVYLYGTKRVTPETVDALNLICVQLPTFYRCFDTTAKAEASEVNPLKVQCPGGYSGLFTYKHAGYSGRGVSLFRTGAWYNLGPKMNNETSSFIIGDHAAHLSSQQNGVGNWYPGDTSKCANKNDLAGTGWDNRISSRFRVN
jgi:hypothetical protein